MSDGGGHYVPPARLVFEDESQSRSQSHKGLDNLSYIDTNLHGDEEFHVETSKPRRCNTGYNDAPPEFGGRGLKQRAGGEVEADPVTRPPNSGGED